MEILYQSGVDHMDIPRGEIILESPLEFVDLGGVLQKFKDRGYLEILITRGEIEEGYVFIENESIIGVFYEGKKKGGPLQNVQELLREKPAIVLHRLTETQLNVLKEFYPLDKKYEIGELFGAEEITKTEEAVTEKRVEEAQPKPAFSLGAPLLKSSKAEAKKGKIMWEDEIPILTKGGHTTMIGREEFLRDIDDPFVRDILKLVDGRKTVGEIIKKSGQKPEDVIGVIEPYKRMGYIKFKK
ncbi:MAG: DUF2226 domain-containing protein [Methanomicrobia archaeon]|nr:DUF2226 domain-containing protein [Methanomicrobia archaeon]